MNAEQRQTAADLWTKPTDGNQMDEDGVETVVRCMGMGWQGF